MNANRLILLAGALLILGGCERPPVVAVQHGYRGTGMLEIYNHQLLWDYRMEPRIYDAFVDIWDREDLCVTIDRANLNPPMKIKGNPLA